MSLHALRVSFVCTVANLYFYQVNLRDSDGLHLLACRLIAE
jgi:hypothetical protein